MPTLEELMQEAAGLAGQQRTAAGTIQSEYDAMAAAEAERVNAIRSAGAAEGVITGQARQAELTAQTNARRAATSFGTNMDSPDEIVTKLGSELQASFGRADAIGDKITEKRNIRFLDNPLGAIGAMLTLPGDIAAYNAEADNYNRTERHLQSMQAATQTNVTTQNSLKETATAATVDAAVQQVKAKTDLAAITAQQQARAYNVAGVTAVVEMNSKAYNTALSAMQVQENAADRQLRREQLNLALDEAQERIRQRTETAQDDAAMVEMVNLGLSQLNGGRPSNITARDIKLMQNTPQIRQAWQIGAQTKIRGTLSVSDNAGESAMILAQTRGKLPAGMEKTQAVLEQGLAEARSGKVTIDPKAVVEINKPESVIAATDANVKYLVDNYTRVIQPNDFSNPYLAPDLQSVAALKGVQGTAFFERVVKPQMATGFNQMDPAQLANLAVSAVKQKTVTMQEAARGLHLMVQGAMLLNNTQQRYSSVGLPVQSSYNAPVQTGFGVQIRNFADLTQIQNVLSSQLAAEKFKTESLMTPGF